MAKNRVAPERQQFSNKKDNFFNKTKSSIKSSFKTKDRFKKQNTFKSNIKQKSEFKQKSTFEPPVESGSGDFFVKTTEKTELSQKSETNTKKPFDKKQWRLQKYSKKYKLDQWEDHRKKTILKGYYNEIKHDDLPKLDVQKIYEQDEIDQLNEENENNLNASIVSQRMEEVPEDTNVTPINRKQKKKVFKKAHDEFLRIKDEKQVKKEEAQKRKAEKEQALKEYKQKKAEKYKKLSKKTKKGQPIMKYRMEMLLEQIQKQC